MVGERYEVLGWLSLAHKSGEITSINKGADEHLEHF